MSTGAKSMRPCLVRSLLSFARFAFTEATAS